MEDFSKNKDASPSFWDHLEVLRGILWRCLVVWLLGTVFCFIFKDILFSFLFAPSKSDFALYRFLCSFAQITGLDNICVSDFEVQFINTELTAQFTTHLKVSLWAGLVLTAPYVVYLLYTFISPALYMQERRYSFFVIFIGGGLFVLGVMLNYFLIFPLSFRFLSTYQVQSDVINMISLSSYITTFLVLSLLLGMFFEIPLLGWFLAKIKLLDATMLRHYRRQALVGVMVIAAVITPTADAITLFLVTLPIYLLYEITILVVANVLSKSEDS